MAEKLLSQGVSRTILGAGIEDRELVKKLCHRFDGASAVSLDDRDGNLTTARWHRHTVVDVIQLSREKGARMRNRPICLLVLFSMVPVFGLVLPAPAGALHTPEGGVRHVIAAIPEAGFASANRALTSSSSQCTLNISSTAGGSVTTPGEGTFTYEIWTVVDLVAEPEEGYRFVSWTGNVSTVGNVTAATTNVTMDGDYSITANFVPLEGGDVGVKPGDWIRITYNVTGLPAGQRYAKWLKLEFLSVEGPIVNVLATIGVSDGSQGNYTKPVDVVSGSDFPMLPGIIIPANRTTGDSVYVAGYGNVTIEGETTRAYAGADRTVVYAGFSQNETQITYYWDKLTGVMVGKSSISPSITGTGEATETNMWGSPTKVGTPWWPWIVVGAAVVAGVTIFFVRRRAKVPAAQPGETQTHEPS